MLCKDKISYVLNRILRSNILCLKSSYFWACFVYLLYCQMAIQTNLHDPDISERVVGNNQVLLGFARVCISFLFLLTWMTNDASKSHRKLTDPFLLPDYLDLFASIWLLLSAMMYREVVDMRKVNRLLLVRRIETSAWLIELLGSIGWTYSWYIHYLEEFGRKRRPTAGRGWTLDDPDIIVHATNIVTSGLFFVANLGSLYEDDTDSTLDLSYLVNIGDKVFMFNAWVCLTASMRDCDVFWFMPTWGSLSSLDEIIVAERESRNEYLSNTQKVNEANSGPKFGSPNKSLNTTNLGGEAVVPLLSPSVENQADL